MSYSSKKNADFVHYFESMVNLDALEGMTADLGVELQDAQSIMNQIKTAINAIPKNAQDSLPGPNYSSVRHEDLSNFLSDRTPQLLMPDMDEKTCLVDIDNAIETIMSYAEEIKKSLVVPDSNLQAYVKRDVQELDFEKYASSLDVLCKQLSNMKLSKQDDAYKRNPEIEAKLEVLCDDVNMFTKMVQAKTTLCERNQNWTTSQQQNEALHYDHIINKLLSGINEVSYLLDNFKN